MAFTVTREKRRSRTDVCVGMRPCSNRAVLEDVVLVWHEEELQSTVPVVRDAVAGSMSKSDLGREN